MRLKKHPTKICPAQLYMVVCALLRHEDCESDVPPPTSALFQREVRFSTPYREHLVQPFVPISNLQVLSMTSRLSGVP